MSGLTKRVYEMLVRVLIFADTYKQFFEKESITGNLIEQIGEAVRDLSGHATSQVSGKTATRLSAEERDAARKDLKQQLEIICRTARGLNLTHFWMPAGKSDVVLVTCARSFVQNLESLKHMFIESHLPVDFVANLNAAADILDKRMNGSAFSTASRMQATHSIHASRDAAINALKQLDPIVQNLIRNDPGILAAWQNARRVQRAPKAKAKAAPAVEQSPPVPPSATETGNSAAQA